MKIAVASDHAGFKMKQEVMKFLHEEGHIVQDFGSYSDESSDYPDFAHPLADAVENHDFDLGISMCGSGNGIKLNANKHKGIRSALCWNEEIARLARLHNDANICALPARFINTDQATEIIKKFLSTGFEGGRHLRRIKKIPQNS